MPLPSGLLYFTDTRTNLDVAPESALALIRGLSAQYSGFVWGQIPDRARRAPFRDDDVEIAAELNRTAMAFTPASEPGLAAAMTAAPQGRLNVARFIVGRGGGRGLDLPFRAGMIHGGRQMLRQEFRNLIRRDAKMLSDFLEMGIAERGLNLLRRNRKVRAIAEPGLDLLVQSVGLQLFDDALQAAKRRFG